MERRKFIRACCYTTIGMPIIAATLQSCGAIYYAKAEKINNKLVVRKTEFIYTKKDIEKVGLYTFSNKADEDLEKAQQHSMSS